MSLVEMGEIAAAREAAAIHRKYAPLAEIFTRVAKVADQVADAEAKGQLKVAVAVGQERIATLKNEDWRSVRRKTGTTRYAGLAESFDEVAKIADAVTDVDLRTQLKVAAALGQERVKNLKC